MVSMYCSYHALIYNKKNNADHSFQILRSHSLILNVGKNNAEINALLEIGMDNAINMESVLLGLRMENH